MKEINRNFLTIWIILNMCYRETQPFLSMIKGMITSVTHHPVVTVLTIFLLVTLICMIEGKVICPFSIVGDIWTTTSDNWGRKLNLVPAI